MKKNKYLSMLALLLLGLVSLVGCVGTEGNPPLDDLYATNIIFVSASDIVAPANTAAALEITDGTNKLLAFDTRNTVTGVTSALFSAAPPTIASAAGDTYSQVGIAAKIINLTGSNAVTALDGLQLYVNAPTVTDADAVIVTKASTVYIAAPAQAGSATITNKYALELGGDLFIGANKLRTTTLGLYESAPDRLSIVKISDSTLQGISVGTAYVSDVLQATGNACAISARDVDSNYINIKARDSGVGLVVVGRIFGAADPYLQAGRNDTGVSTNIVTDHFYLQAGAGTTNVANNFGLGVPIYLSNAAHEVEERASIDFTLVDATNGSEDVDILFNIMAGGVAPAMALTLDGTGGIMMPQASVEPSSTTDRAGIYAIDLSAGNCTLGIDTETAVAADIVTESTHTLSIRINGVTYKVLLATP